MADEENGEGGGEDWTGADYFASGFDFGEGEWDETEDWEPPVVYVEASQRKTVEAFAQQLETLGMPEDCDAPEYLDYCRMDASALLIHLANSRPGVLERLQEAVVSKDVNGFIDALQNAFVLSRDVISSLRTACEAGDKEALAEGLRNLAEEEVWRLMQEAEEQAQSGRELANPTDPLMSNERRVKATYFMSQFTLPEGMTSTAPIPIPNRPDQEPIAYMALELGYDHAAWEEECQMHAYMWDGINAGSDMMQESRGIGFLDGRTVGLRGQGIGIFG